MLTLLLSAALAADPSFFPHAGATLVTLGPELRLGDVRAQLGHAVVVSADDPAALAALPEVRELRVLPGTGHVARLALHPQVDEFAFSRALHARDDVRWAHPDLLVPRHSRTLPSDPGLAEQWHLQNPGGRDRLAGVDIGAPLAWTRATGAGQIVAVLDSGVQADHPDLDVIPGVDVVDGDRDPSPITDESSAGHGTSAAGLIAARANGVGVVGVAYDAQIYAIRLIGGANSFSDTYTTFVDAVDAGASVLNNSWGFGENCPDIPRLGVFEEAIAYAETYGRDGLGTAVVVAAGNGDCDFSNDGWQQFDEMISVGAANARDRREDYSSYGPLLDLSAPSGELLTTDLVGAPGYRAWNDDPDYTDDFSGTSGAAPLVSGTLALMFEANPRLTAAAAREVLCDTAVRIDLEGGAYDASGWSPWYGCGRVDAGAAVLAVANAGPTAPLAGAIVASEWDTEPVLLSWQAATDPDGDPLSYLVELWPAGDKPRRGEQATTAESSLDVTAWLSGAGEYEWRVTAFDLWGEGPVSETGTLTVPKRGPPPEPSKGCAQAPTYALWLGGLAALLLRRRPLRTARPTR
jgi:subtilisin family serine protease